MSIEGGRWSKKAQIFVNVVCERPPNENEKECSPLTDFFSVFPLQILSNDFEFVSILPLGFLCSSK